MRYCQYCGESFTPIISDLTDFGHGRLCPACARLSSVEQKIEESTRLTQERIEALRRLIIDHSNKIISLLEHQEG